MVEQTTVNPHQKFEDITIKILKTDQNIILGLEDILRKSLVDHTTNNKEDQGAALGEYMYAQGEQYIIDTMYPALKGDLDENSREALEERMKATFGLSKKGLVSAFKGKKNVHQAEIAPIVSQATEHLGKNLQGMRVGKFARFADEDLQGTKAYLKSLAGELKIESYDDATI